MPSRASRASSWLPINKLMAAKQMKACMLNPDESPSTPSMRLMALMMPTPAMMVSGRARAAGTRPMFHRWWKWSI